MNEVESRINGNGNWREDTGKTAAQVAAEMNAAKNVLNPGSRYTLMGLIRALGAPATATIEYKVKTAAALLSQSANPVEQVQATGLLQLIDALRVGDGPDFGLQETQTQLDALVGVLDASEIAALKALGVSITYSDVTEADVSAAWVFLFDFWSRQTTASDAQRLANSLGSYLEDPTSFDAILAQLKAL